MLLILLLLRAEGGIAHHAMDAILIGLVLLSTRGAPMVFDDRGEIALRRLDHQLDQVFVGGFVRIFIHPAGVVVGIRVKFIADDFAHDLLGRLGPRRTWEGRERGGEEERKSEEEFELSFH